MKKYLAKRFLIAIPVLLMVTFFCFLIMNLAPGDPTDLYVTDTSTPEQIEMTREKLGLNQPVLIRYYKWLINTLQGDLGFSFTSRMAVTEIMPSKILATIQLLFVTLILSYGIGIPLGILSARKQNSFLDYSITGFSFLGISIPNFFLGLALIYIFSLKLKILPSGGMITLGSGGGVIDRLSHIIMPALVLSVTYSSNMQRYVRSAVIDVYNENYIRTAKSKGLSSFDILCKHGLKNTLVPIITVISTDIPKLIGGAVVTEQIFQWPGIGLLTVSSIASRDYPVLMAINLIAALAVLLFNFIADILYAVVDPRIRY
ncbi:MAG: ABC transporter permease [Streptococcaceae bacterium]|jgi:peptide/nickel transport system permease protein|nr:ABC transporter permease [Streptococcaceae bacterium]MCH4178021.1 ABC transporter permease [Streptococcaceae bacterium]